MSDTDAWRALLGRIVVRGKLVFDTADVSHNAKGTKDPKVWALALLARTIGNIEGAIVLLDAGHAIETPLRAAAPWLSQSQIAVDRRQRLGDRPSGVTGRWRRRARFRRPDDQPRATRLSCKAARPRSVNT
jgi:hypothetical protein